MEALKNFGVGAGTLAVIFAVMYGIEYAALAFGVPEDQVGYYIFAPFIVYLTYTFGGLTRSVYFNKD